MVSLVHSLLNLGSSLVSSYLLGDDHPKGDLETQLHHLISSYSGGGEVSLSYRPLRGKVIGINADIPRWSASTIKIPVMMGVMEEIRKGHLSLDDKLVIDHRFPLEEYDQVTRASYGTPIDIKYLLILMIHKSDNEATNMLADLVGLDRINDLMQNYGATRTMMAHLLTSGVPRITTSWNPDGSNLTTANDLTLLLKQIYSRKDKIHLIMQTLLETHGSGILGMLIPSPKIVGYKEGFISDVLDGSDILEAAMINRSYALAVCVNKIPPARDTFSARFLIEDLSEVVYKHGR